MSQLNDASRDTEVQKILAKWRNEDLSQTEDFATATFKSFSPLVIIGGCARSGTTLLRVMLDSHSQIACGPPTNLFIPTPVDLERLSFQSDLAVDLLSRLYEESRDRAEFIDQFRHQYLLQTGKRVWAEKTARNVRQFSWILDHFPNALLIHVVRDGRDVICSLRTHRKRTVKDSQILPTGYVIPLDRCIERWVADVSAGFQFRGHPNYLEVHYEELVANPEATIAPICNKLKLNFEPRMLSYYEVKGPSRDPLKFPQNIEAISAPYSSSIGRWKRDLTPTELSDVLVRIEPLLRKAGYSL